MTQYLLIDHGSRNPTAHQQLNDLCQKLREEKKIKITCAHLEIAEPYFADILEELCLEKPKQIKVLPLFIFKGKHLSQDLPEIISNAKERHPDINISLETALGDSPLFTNSIADIFNIS